MKITTTVFLLLVVTIGAVLLLISQFSVEIDTAVFGSPVNAGRQHESQTEAVAEQIADKVSSNHKSVEAHSLEGKHLKALADAQQNTGMSLEELQAADAFMIAAFLNPKSSDEFQSDLHAEMEKTLGTEEADFLASVLSSATDFRKVKQLVEQRQDVSGGNYDELLMKTGLASGQISFDEIETLVRHGSALPADAIHQLAYAGQVNTIVSLAGRGYLANVNYQDPTMGSNAAGAFIQSVSYFPDKYEAEEAARMLRELMSIGVAAKPQDGTLDPLDYALSSVNRGNADVKLAMSEVLIEQGVPFENSHREQISKMRDSPIKDRFLELFANSL